MMFLLKWYKELLEIRYEREARKKDLAFCQACETLKVQLAVANDERKFLIEKLTDKPVVEEKQIDISNLKPIMPSRMNWNLRRQSLEAESRAEARIQRENRERIGSSSGNTGKGLTVPEIERELGVNNG